MPSALVVEDDGDVLQVMQRGLEQGGFDVTTCTAVHEAVALIERRAFDAYVIDARLPDGAGLGLCSRLRELRGAEPAVALMTGFSAPTGGLHGADMSLSEPFTPAELATKLRALLARRRSPEILLAEVLAPLVGAACHDINNELHAASGLLEIAQLRMVEGSEPVGPQLARVQAALQAAGAIVRETLQTVRPFYLGGDSQAARIPGAALADEFQRLTTAPQPAAPARVVVEAWPAGVALPAWLLRQVSVPLVENAREARDDDGHVASNIEVRLAPWDDGQGFVVAVSDDGPGWLGQRETIAAGLARGRVFSSKDPARGRGLLLLQRLVERLGGGLRLEDRAPRGACVRVLLPWKMTS